MRYVHVQIVCTVMWELSLTYLLSLVLLQQVVFDYVQSSLWLHSRNPLHQERKENARVLYWVNATTPSKRLYVVKSITFFRNEAPTLKKLLLEINNDPDLPHMGRTSLHGLLRSMGFEFIKQNKLSVIVDRHDISTWRRNYLKSIKQFRTENRHIFYVDETWVHEGHTISKVWSLSLIHI